MLLNFGKYWSLCMGPQLKLLSISLNHIWSLRSLLRGLIYLLWSMWDSSLNTLSFLPHKQRESQSISNLINANSRRLYKRFHEIYVGIFFNSFLKKFFKEEFSQCILTHHIKTDVIVGTTGIQNRYRLATENIFSGHFCCILIFNRFRFVATEDLFNTEDMT